MFSIIAIFRKIIKYFNLEFKLISYFFKNFIISLKINEVPNIIINLIMFDESTAPGTN
uniref:Uncharacterized protein n=1 Tax=viral metagenome TaxID=1070528 RepID=A0A6C0H8T8_9ZZZZ